MSTRSLWILLLALQGILLVACVSFALLLNLSEPSVRSTVRDQAHCAGDARQEAGSGAREPREVLARCEFLERKVTALELTDSKLSRLISAAFFCLVGALVIFILIEIAIIVKVNRRRRQGSPSN
jgi:hypothetical protein